MNIKYAVTSLAVAGTMLASAMPALAGHPMQMGNMSTDINHVEATNVAKSNTGDNTVYNKSGSGFTMINTGDSFAGAEQIVVTDYNAGCNTCYQSRHGSYTSFDMNYVDAKNVAMSNTGDNTVTSGSKMQKPSRHHSSGSMTMIHTGDSEAYASQWVVTDLNLNGN